MNIVFVTFKFSHHGKHAGYDKLIDSFPNSMVINGQLYEKFLFFIQRQPKIIKKVLNKLVGNKRHWIEYWVLFKAKNSSDTIVHFLYPENQYRRFGKFKGKRKIVATFHQPPDFYDNVALKKKKNYKYIDKAIVVSRNMIKKIEEYVGNGKVVYIPHGVDINFFRPPKNPIKKTTKKILTVGNWKRDFKLLSKVAKKMMEIDDTIIFEIISLEKNKYYFEGLPNVVYRSNITDEQLLEAYHTCNVLFLPLMDCTANNALLEGLASGVPTILVSDVGGVRDYANKKNTIFLNQNISAEIICKFIVNKIINMEYMKIDESFIDAFNWEKISSKIYYLYLELIKKDIVKQ